MTLGVSKIDHSTSILDRPIFLPVKIALSPLTGTVYIVKRIFQSFFGYFVNLGVFPYGSMNSSWLKRKIIEKYQGGCYDTHDRALLDPGRLNAAFKVLEDIGGISMSTHSKDGTKLDTMFFRYQDLKERIEKNGGKFDCLPISGITSIKEKRIVTTQCSINTKDPKEFIDVIIPDEKRNIHDWAKFCKNVLDPCYLERTKITLENGKVVDGYILNHWDAQKPIIRSKEDQVFIRDNAPTEATPMGKRDIIRHVLGLRANMLCFDYPGTWKSEGTPSEGAYYLAAETMVEKAVNEYGYAYDDIWAEGFCLGGAVAAHVFCKYRDKGINLATQNTFNRMYNTLHKEVWPVNVLSKIKFFGMAEELKSKNPKIIQLVKQDCFDTIQKLERLPPPPNAKGGICAILNTDTDTRIDLNSNDELYTAASRVSKTAFKHMYKPTENRNKNGHSLDVLGERENWDWFRTCVTYKDYPEVLNPPAKAAIPIVEIPKIAIAIETPKTPEISVKTLETIPPTIKPSAIVEQPTKKGLFNRLWMLWKKESASPAA